MLHKQCKTVMTILGFQFRFGVCILDANPRSGVVRTLYAYGFVVHMFLYNQIIQKYYWLSQPGGYRGRCLVVLAHLEKARPETCYGGSVLPIQRGVHFRLRSPVCITSTLFTINWPSHFLLVVNIYWELSSFSWADFCFRVLCTRI